MSPIAVHLIPIYRPPGERRLAGTCLENCPTMWRSGTVGYSLLEASILEAQSPKTLAKSFASPVAQTTEKSCALHLTEDLYNGPTFSMHLGVIDEGRSGPCISSDTYY